MTRSERRDWADEVLLALEPELDGVSNVVIFAGTLYRQDLVPALEARGQSLTVPLARLGIGKQLAWFKARQGERP